MAAPGTSRNVLATRSGHHHFQIWQLWIQPDSLEGRISFKYIFPHLELLARHSFQSLPGSGEQAFSLLIHQLLFLSLPLLLPDRLFRSKNACCTKVLLCLPALVFLTRPSFTNQRVYLPASAVSAVSLTTLGRCGVAHTFSS